MGVLLLVSLALLLLGVSVGSTGFESVLNMQRDPQAMQIIWEIRLPRTAGAWLAGALLGLAGAVAQGLFRNPLADPYLLGSASGAALGVALAMALFGVSPLATHWVARLGLTGAAFIGAVAAVLLTLLLGTPTLSLIGSIGAALTLGVRGAGVLLSLLILPLYIPVLIFGAGAVEADAAGLGMGGHLSLLAALLVLSIFFAPLATTTALRISLE